MAKTKQLSNPFSTGTGGSHFEAHIQASFVVLMLTRGYAPCLPCWPIVEVKLQGKIDGFDTDDLVVVVEDANSQERRKLLGQIKHSITITQGNSIFGEVLQAAWNDFNNPAIFTKNKDIIALITGPLSAADTHNVQWLLSQARHTRDVDEFFRNVQQTNFSPPKCIEKLDAIKHHLKVANGGIDLSRDELYAFLKHFHLLGYDLGSEFGVVLSLLHSHISQFQQQFPQWLWSRVVDIVQTWNQDAGCLSLDNIPEDILEAFKQKTVVTIPEEFKLAQGKAKTDWTLHPDATYLALAILIGGWSEKTKCDLEVVTQLLGISYEAWLNKAREILLYSDSPLSLKNGVWQVVNRAELWSGLGQRILDQNLETFRELAISVLKEANPAFELPAEERYTANIQGKVFSYSSVLRNGIADGLAILSSQSEACSHCSQGKAEATSIVVVRELLADADWLSWGSLNSLLPTLAEASPNEFLDAVERAMTLNPNPFDTLFAQEGSGIAGKNYLTGLLWALEGLAWDERYLVRVCVVLAELATHDPGGNWANRPINSLTNILLPWLPQTLASIEKRKVAVRTIVNECPNVAWNLIIRLLPNQHQISSGAYKPKWLKTIPHHWEKGVTHQEYWEQVSFYAELAVANVGQDIGRLSTLINHFANLPKPAFDQLLQVLASKPIVELPEDQRLLLWQHLTKFTHKYRRFSDAKWALPDELLTRIEQVTDQLAPINPFHLYQYLFAGNDFDFYEENVDWKEQHKALNAKREQAILELFQLHGVDGVIKFAESVASSHQVGAALGSINEPVIEQNILPKFLDSIDNKLRAMVSSFIWRCYYLQGWKWCESIDKSNWSSEQVGQFLAYLPFTKEIWKRAFEWLQADEDQYWLRTDANAYETDENLAIAIDKLIEYGRPHAALACLYRMLHDKQLIDSTQCIRALLAALSSNEPDYTIKSYYIIELIKSLQADTSVNQDDLFKVEWAYVPLLNEGVIPQHLESKLANDADFFCELIRLIYRSKKEEQQREEPSKDLKAIATNAWRLLYNWRTPPGTQKDGAFSEEHFKEWLQKVKVLCTESGHLEVAFIEIGKVLIHVPPDSDGLWINNTVAAALNDRDAADMRKGFKTGIYNSRGVHYIDPTGKPEKELAKQFRIKAEAVENAGFQRFAATLKELACSYDREGDRIISDHK